MKGFHSSVGIDLAKRSKHKAVVVRNGTTGSPAPKRAFAFSGDLEGLHALRDYMIELTQTGALDDVAVNMEPTGGAWETVSAFLGAQGAKVHFTRPDVVSAIRKVHSKFAKTDRIDARTLANIPFSFPDRLVPIAAPEKRIRKLRDLGSQRQRFVEDATRWKNRFTAKVEIVWRSLLIEIDDSQRFCKLVRAFFKRFTDPRKVRRYGHDRFETWCRKNAHGRTSPELFGTLWREALACARLWDEMEEIGAMRPDWETLSALLRQDLRTIENIEKEIRTIDKQIKEARKQVPECDVLEGLPRVGKVITATLAGILMPIERFANAKKCGAYTGFTSRQKSSAGREIEGLRITKSGNRRLKRDLALAADTAMHQDPGLAAFAARLLKSGKHYNKVRVAVGRKVAVRAYSLLKRFARGESDAAYTWRDLEGNTIAKQEAKRLADTIWACHKTEKK